MYLTNLTPQKYPRLVLLMALSLFVSTSSFANNDAPPAEGETTIRISRDTVPSHGGRNGGDSLEIDLRRMSQQIATFLAGPVGREEFPQINGAHIGQLADVEFDVVTEPVLDRHNTERTCVNQMSTRTITCNINRWNMVQQMSVRYVLLFHELLGLQGLEIGYDDNVSSYPISAKLLEFASLVESINLDNPVDRVAVDNSYGVEYKNRRTGESVKLICAYDAEIHRCDTFTIIKSLNGIHVPMQVANKYITMDEIRVIGAGLEEQISAGSFQYDISSDRHVITRDAPEADDSYSEISFRRFGTGATQRFWNGFCETREDNSRYGRADKRRVCKALFSFLPPVLPVLTVVDVAAEIGIQALNVVLLPFKGIAQGIRNIKARKRRNRLAKFFNVKNSISRMNVSERLTNRRYNQLILDLEMILGLPTNN